MNRRRFAAGLAATALAALAPRPAPAAAPADVLAASWALWKRRHLDRSGRVVDALQGGSSHSEGQGYALALAALMGDAEAADAVVRWTDDHLARRDDALLSWRWLPDGGVVDRNNASDGDLFFAWGCLAGGRRFGRADWVDRAARIAEALAASCLVADPHRRGRLLLLPGVEGFRKGSTVTVNPSYLMPRLMKELGEATGRPELVQAADDGTTLLADLAAEGTTPDWIAVTPRGPAVSPAHSDRTGYEAVRTPLFLVWSGLDDHPMLPRHRRLNAASAPRPNDVATVFDRRSGAVLERSGDVGYLAVAALLDCAAPGARTPGLPPLVPFGAAQPYYPATLHMLALVAQTQRFPACIPL